MTHLVPQDYANVLRIAQLVYFPLYYFWPRYETIRSLGINVSFVLVIDIDH